MSTLTAEPITTPPTLPPATPARLTVDEFLSLYGGRYAELIAGVPVLNEPANPGYVMPEPRHGLVCSEMGYHLTHHVKQRDLGRVVTHDSFVLVSADPPTVLGPDIFFAPYERLPRGELPKAVPAEAIDLAVEVRSPSNTWTQVFAKVVDYLEAGVRVVVVLDPGTRTASVYRPDVLQELLGEGAELTLPDILPGFAVSVGKLFE